MKMRKKKASLPSMRAGQPLRIFFYTSISLPAGPEKVHPRSSGALSQGEQPKWLCDTGKEKGSLEEPGELPKVVWCQKEK